MRGRADPITEISVFATQISVTGMKIFPYEHYRPVTGTKHNAKANLLLPAPPPPPPHTLPRLYTKKSHLTWSLIYSCFKKGCPIKAYATMPIVIMGNGGLWYLIEALGVSAT